MTVDIALFDGIRLELANQPTSFHGTIAGQRIHSSLACFFVRATIAAQTSEPLLAEAQQLRSLPPDVLSLQAELEGLPVDLAVVHEESGSLIDCENAQLWVDHHGQSVQLLPKRELTLNTLQHWMFGPGLILALANRGIFCLHASAVQIDAGAYLLIGRSGAGKSTLAKHAEHALCDDICALGATTPLHLLHDFPQLKLPLQHYPNPADFVPAHGFVHVTSRASLAEIKPLSELALTRLLLQNTVASRLFRPELLRAHFSWAARTAKALQQRSFALQPAQRADDPAAGAVQSLALLHQAVIAA